MFGFAKMNWSVILLAALIAIIGWQFYSITSERDEYFNQLTNERHARDIAVATKKGELKALLEIGKRALADQKAQHMADIQHIGTLYGKVINNDQKAITYRNGIIDKLRQQQAANDLIRVPKDDAGQSAESNSNAATTGLGEESEEFYKSAYLGQREYIKTLEQAGAICAADFNSCIFYKNSEQGRLGVEGR